MKNTVIGLSYVNKEEKVCEGLLMRKCIKCLLLKFYLGSKSPFRMMHKMMFVVPLGLLSRWQKIFQTTCWWFRRLMLVYLFKRRCRSIYNFCSI